MNAHINSEETIKEAMMKVKQSGLELGTKAVCKAIYDITQSKATDETKLKAITDFCEKGLGLGKEDNNG